MMVGAGVLMGRLAMRENAVGMTTSIDLLLAVLLTSHHLEVLML